MVCVGNCERKGKPNHNEIKQSNKGSKVFEIDTRASSSSQGLYEKRLASMTGLEDYAVMEV